MRYVANIFLALMLIFTVILMPNYSFSLEFQETEDSISCCKSEGGLKIIVKTPQMNIKNAEGIVIEIAVALKSF